MRRRLLGIDAQGRGRHAGRVGTRAAGPGQGRSAEAPIREALKIRLAVFGEEHRETATSKAELALWLFERGEVDQAVQLQRENVATSERVLGASHANVAAAKRNLGQMLLAQGDAAGAETLLREALEVTRRNFGEAHAQFATALNACRWRSRSRGGWTRRAASSSARSRSPRRPVRRTRRGRCRLRRTSAASRSRSARRGKPSLRCARCWPPGRPRCQRGTGGLASRKACWRRRCFRRTVMPRPSR